jgi:hypothetical protein
VAPRTSEQRKADLLSKLREDKDVWVATAGTDGHPHLVPLSLCWDGEQVIVTLEAMSRTARNAVATGRARLALGPTRDVVMIDATVESTPVDAVPEIAESYADRTGWDPRMESAKHVFLLLRPTRIQVWREVDEIQGRTLMRRGKWVV